MYSVVFRIFLRLYESKRTIYCNKIYSPSAVNHLLEILKGKHFPEDCFDIHYPVIKHFAQYTKGMTPDLTVINPNTMHPIAFFRAYNNVDDFKQDVLYDEAYHLNKHSSTLLLYPYYIFIKDEEYFYELRTLIAHGKDITLTTESCAPIDYKILCNSDNLRLYRNQIFNRTKLQKNGKIAFSIVVPLLALIWLFLDQFKIFEITELRLIVFSIIIVSLLIPYITQFTIKNVSVAFKEKGRNK